MDVTEEYLQAKDLNALGNALEVGYVTTDGALYQVEAFDTATNMRYLYTATKDGDDLITLDTQGIDFNDHTYQLRVLVDSDPVAIGWEYDELDEEYFYSSQIVQVHFNYKRDSLHDFVRAETQTVEIDA